MRDDSPTIFDAEADEAADLTEQFWGSSRGWIPPERVVDDRSHGVRNQRDLTGSMQVIRDGFAALRPRHADTTDRISRTGRTRQHGVTRPEASLAELARGVDVGGFGPDFDVELDVGFDGDDPFATRPDDTRPVADPRVAPLADRLGVGAVDPLLLRLGVVLLIGALLVPLAMALRPSRVDGAIQTSPAGAAIAEPAPASHDGAATPETLGVANESTAPAGAASLPVDQPPPEPAPDAVAAAAADAAAAPAAVPAAAPPPASTVETVAPADAADVGDVQQDQTATDTAEVVTVTAEAERLMPACPETYDAAAGDSWYRIASAAGVTPDVLMSENRATVDTPIFPGDEICLPAGAAMPEPPATTAPPNTVAAPTPTTVVSTTTTTTTTAPPPAPASKSEVQALIREIWPDELEEKALQIAYRESGYDASAHNGWCCYGVFQIYWTVHDGWLEDHGINSSNDLLDARKNITAAYALYQRSGGWGPWGG